MRNINDEDLVRILVVLIKFRIEAMEQVQEMETYVKKIGRERDHAGDGNLNTKEIAYEEYLHYESFQLN